MQAGAPVSEIPVVSVWERQVPAEGRARLLLLLPALGFLLLVFAYPLGVMVLRSVSDPKPGVEHYVQIATVDVYLRVFYLTFRLALTVTAATLLLGYPVAYLLVRVRGALRTLLIFLVLLPFWTSLLVRTYAWMVILGRYGIVNRLLMALGITDEPIRLLHTSFATHVGMIHILLPFMILPIWSVMSGISTSLLMAAQSLGASPLRAYRTVFLPLSLPGVWAGSLLVFILTLGFYVTPALLGGRGDLTIAMLVAQQVSELLAWGFASALAITLLVLTLTLLLLASRLPGVWKVWEARR